MTDMRSTGYPVDLVEEVRRLHRDGVSVPQIRDRLAKRWQDPLPSMVTLYHWTDDAYKQRAYAANRRRRGMRQALDGASKLRSDTPEYRAGLVRRFVMEGVSNNALIPVCRVLFDDPEFGRAGVDELLHQAAEVLDDERDLRSPAVRGRESEAA